MHLVEKIVKGRPYFYLVEKARQGKRVFTARTIYVGDRQKLADLLQGAVSSALPRSFSSQEIGASLALSRIAGELDIESIIDGVVPVRRGAAPVGRQVLLAALHRVLAPRGENGKSNLRPFYLKSALVDLLPFPDGGLDDRRIGDTFRRLTSKQIEAIESAIVKRVIEHEGISLDALAFDCTNFDSYAGARTPSRLLKRGHSKSGRSLRTLGLGLLVTEDGGIPLVSLTYPGNENDVTAFRRFLGALDRRSAALPLPLDATIAADGGNISKAILRRMESTAPRPRHYVLRLPERHAAALTRVASADLPILDGFVGKVRAQSVDCAVYGVTRRVVDVYSPRMHRRQLPGLRRDRKKAHAELIHLQKQLDLQRRGLRRAKPITVTSLKRRVAKALAREYMDELYSAQIEAGEGAPKLTFTEDEDAWRRLETHVLGRTLLVTNRREWTAGKVVRASRQQSHNEWFFREIKDPAGGSMLPLRHRRDHSLRANALVVTIGAMLLKVLVRRAKKAEVPVRSVNRLLRQLKAVQRGRMHFSSEAPPAIRAVADKLWVPSERIQRQSDLLRALGLETRPELGSTPFSGKTGSGSARKAKN